nr:Ger(x)C family spore germination protein [Paenibacillus swuensis]
MKASVFQVLLCCMMLTGCWDYRELGEIQIVSGMGIEAGTKAKYRLYIEIIRTAEFVSDKRLGSARSYVVEEEVNTVADGVTVLNKKLNKHIEFSHLQLLVIDQELLRKGDLSYLDFIERYREVRNNILMVGAEQGKVKAVMSTVTPDLSVSTYKIREQLQEYYRDYGGTYPIKLQHFVRDLGESGRSPIMPMVTIADETEKGTSIEAAKQIEVNDVVEIAGMGVFRKGKLAGILNNEETRDAMLTHRQFKESAMEMPCGKGKYVSLYLQHQDGNIHVEMRRGEPHLFVDLDLTARLDESQCKGYFDGSSEDFEKIEEQGEKVITARIKKVIQKVQRDFKADMFGFGSNLRERDNKSYKKIKNEWNEQFAAADLEVKVRLNLRRAGIRYGSMELKE